MATVGELLVVFRASTGAFTRDLDRVNKLSFDTSKEIERSFKRIGAVVATELVAAAGAVTAAVAKTIDNAEQMGHLAQQVAMTTEQFTALAYAAKQSDVSADELTSSLVKMEKALDKSNEQTLEGKAAHSALATLFKGNIPVFADANEAFIKIADALSKLPSEMQRTALQQQIFGKGSKQMTELILEGASGINKLREEALRYGQVISDKTAKAADEFGDTLKRVKAVIDGLLLSLAERLLPVLQDLADKLLQNTKNAAEYEKQINGLAAAVKVLLSAVIGGALAFNVLGNAVATAMIALNTFATGGMVGGLDELKASWGDTADAGKSFVSTLKSIWADATNASDTATTQIESGWTRLMSALRTIVAQDEARRLKAQEDAKKQAEDLAKALKQADEALMDQVVTLAHGANALQLYKLQAQGATQADLDHIKALQQVADNLEKGLPAFNTAWDNYIDSVQKATAAIDTHAESSDKFSTKEFDALQRANDMYIKLTSDGLTDYYDKLQQLDLLKQAGIITDEQVAAATDRLNHEFGLVSETLAEQINWSKQARKEFEKMFTDAIFGAKGFKDALLSMIDAFAQLIFKALVLEPLMDSLFGKAGAGGGSSGGLLGGFFTSIGNFFGFGGGKAGGGSVYSGRSYIVGEEGPEVFYPSISGTIVPNGPGGQTVYQIDARGADPTVEFRIRRALQETESRAVQRSVVATREMQMRNV